MNEAETCRQFFRPRLDQAGWSQSPHLYTKQDAFTAGCIVVTGGHPRRLRHKFTDFFLRYTRDLALAIVETTSASRPAGDGMQQARDYAATLGLPFAYATNGTTILEHDAFTHQERELDRFLTPDELWHRYQRGRGLTTAVPNALLVPYSLKPDREPRYYQRLAITRAVEALVGDTRRVLLTLATGTGKTQVAWKLWSAAWHAKGEPARKPRIFFFADRNILVDDPMARDFSPFGDARHKIGGQTVKSREMYAADQARPGQTEEGRDGGNSPEAPSSQYGFSTAVSMGARKSLASWRAGPFPPQPPVAILTLTRVCDL